MLEAFTYMFKIDGAKKHWLFFISLFLFSSVLSYSFILIFKNEIFNSLFSFVILFLAIIIFVIPGLILNGYFWNLTDNIVYRDHDVDASLVYDGKIKNINIITLPDLNIRRHIWRSLASLVAMFIMFLPFLLIILLSAGVSVLSGGFKDFALLYASGYVGLIILMLLLLPSLMWNYAKQDSIFAGLNIIKAIHIIGNYPLVYIRNVVLIVIVNILGSIILYNLSLALGVSDTVVPRVSEAVYYFYSLVQGLYIIYVHAFLLGTLAPTNEQ